MIYDVIIIGAGPAGISAAIYAKNAGLNTLIIEQNIIGGKLNEIDGIYNYPGFNFIKGNDLANKMADQIRDIEIVYDKAIKIVKASDDTKLITGTFSEYMGKNVLVAIGTKPKELKIPIDNDRLSYCELCEGFLCSNQNVVIIGGGNSAFSCALYLSKIAKHIHMAIRKDKPKAEKALVNLVESNRKIEIMYNTEIERSSGKRIFFTNGVSILPFKIFVKIGEEANKIETTLGENDGVYNVGSCSGLTPNQIITAESDAATTLIKKILITNTT